MFYEPTLIDQIKMSTALDTVLQQTDSNHHGSKGRYLCPACGRNDCAAFFARNGVRIIKCHACGFCGDIVAVYALRSDRLRRDVIQTVLADFADRLESLPDVKRRAPPQASATGKNAKDYNNYIMRCQRNMLIGSPGWDYLSRRGFDCDDIRFLRDQRHIGYDDSCTAHGVLLYPVKTIVMPYYDDKRRVAYYRARAIDNSKIRYTGPQGPQDDTPTIFNSDQLDIAEHVFIVESELDALSIEVAMMHAPYKYHVGAVATGGAGNQKPLIERLNRHVKARHLYIMPDCDEAGKNGAGALYNAIKDIDVNVYLIDADKVLGKRYQDKHGTPSKDANDVLQWHGPVILANLINAIVGNPVLFSTSIAKTHKGNDD